MAKKAKKAKAAAAAAAAAAASQTASSTTAFDLDQQLRHNQELFNKTHPKLAHIFEENETSFSLPSSPVIKATPSIQPSPTLSASATQTVDENFKPVSLPPLNIGAVLEPGVVPEIDWSLFNTQPIRGRQRTQPKVEVARPKSLVSEGTVHEDSIETSEVEEEEEPDQRGGDVQEHSPERVVEKPTETAPKPVTSSSPPPQTPQTPHTDYPYFPPFPYPGFYPRGRMAYPMPYGYGPPPGDGSPYQTPYPPFHYPYPHPRKLERHDSMASRGSGSGELAGLSTPPQMIADSSAIEDDPSDLLGRLHLAIPDLEQLLRRYKETHGELGLREALVRKKEAESLETLKRKEEHIDRLMNQFHDTEKKHSREYNKLRMHIGGLEENLKDLEERLHISESKRKQESASNKELSEQKAALVRERMLIAKAAADERDRLVADYEASKTDTEKQLDAERIRVAELSTHKAELESEVKVAKAELESQVKTSKAEIESQVNKTKEELEAKAAASQEAADKAQQELEAVKAELAAEKADNANGWEEKRTQLTGELETEKQALIKAQEEAIEALKKAHKSDLNDQTVAFVGLQESLNLKMTTENQNLIEEIANLKKAWDEDKTKFEKMIEDLKGVAQGMEEEKGRLEKIVDQFKDETDVKSKGDLHYIESLKHLSDLVFGLCSNHFNLTPKELAPEILARVPTVLPSIVEDTDESRGARHAFIAHTISSILLERVFTPFLFGLGQRQQDTQSLLENVSDQLRAKSSRKEATWRQHTLLAAYTTTDAKLQMNREAGKVMDDIVAAILPFAVGTEGVSDEIRAAVRKIVKLAVETWRYARLEREMIEAVMPSADDDEGQVAAEGYWLPYGSQKPESTSSDGLQKQMLLRVFPMIRREKVQEGFRMTPKDCNDQGCVYSKGCAFYTQ